MLNELPATDHRLPTMENLFKDIRYSIRMLLKRPGFTAIAVATLALGIGINTAIFSIVNTVLLRPMPYQEPERLVMVWGSQPQLGMTRNLVSPANYFDWQTQSRAFEQTGAWTEAFFNLTGDGEPERVPGVLASHNLFATLGVSPALGRAFSPEEGQPGQNRVAVLSYGLWQRRFGASPAIVGNTITVNDQPHTVIGIMPQEVLLPGIQPDLFVPFAPLPQQAGNRQARFLTVVARLNSGVTVNQARSEMEAISGRLQQQYPETNSGHSINIASIYDEITGQVRPSLLVLLGAVGFVLLIACSNVANLLLAAAAARQKEMAIRAALGAGRFRVIRQLLTEALLLSATGGILGLLMALWGVDLLMALSPSDIPRAEAIALDGRVLAFTLAISLFTGLVFGSLPAIRASKVDLNESLKEGGRSAAGSVSGNRLRRLLVVGEIALAFVLLAGAGLMMKSFARLQEVDPGINPENVVAMDISLTSAYDEAAQWTNFFEQVISRVENLPGARFAAVTNHLPLSGEDGSRSFIVEGSAPSTSGEKLSAEFRRVSRNYFSAMGIPLLRGRSFAEQVSSEGPGEIIINQSLARRFFPGEDPLGKRLMVDDGPARLREIIGVVGDVKHFGLGAEPEPELYVSHRDRPWFNMALVIRAEGDPASLVASARRAIAEVDKNIPVANIKMMEQYLAASVARQRFSMILLGVFAIMAMALAAIGIYGVIAYSISQRTREIGIRMALGAQRRDVLKLVVGGGMAMVLTGLAIGLVAALIITRILESLLYEVSATDPATFLIISLMLASVALAACYIPARRAARVDPMEALRYE